MLLALAEQIQATEIRTHICSYNKLHILMTCLLQHAQLASISDLRRVLSDVTELNSNDMVFYRRQLTTTTQTKRCCNDC